MNNESLDMGVTEKHATTISGVIGSLETEIIFCKENNVMLSKVTDSLCGIQALEPDEDAVKKLEEFDDHTSFPKKLLNMLEKLRAENRKVSQKVDRLQQLI